MTVLHYTDGCPTLNAAYVCSTMAVIPEIHAHLDFRLSCWRQHCSHLFSIWLIRKNRIYLKGFPIVKVMVKKEAKCNSNNNNNIQQQTTTT